MTPRRRWIAAPLALAVAAAITAACVGEAKPRVAPTSDRPTFVWIFSDP